MTDHAHELRRYARKIAHPAGDVPAVMLAAADEIERLQGVIAGLRADFETAHARMMTSAATEREACANVCEEIEDDYRERESLRYAELKTDAQTGASDCAHRIRARGDA